MLNHNASGTNTTTDPSNSPREWFDYDALSAWLGVPKVTLYSKVSRLEIPHHRIGRRTVRFRRDEIEAWLERGRVEPTRATEPVFLDVDGDE